MNDITVDKTALLEQLRANRTEHRGIFEEAQVRYRELVIQELDVMLAEARGGRKIRRSVQLIEPEDHTADYDRVIQMLEMSVDDKTVLDELSFNQYVLDNWRWQEQFLTSNSAYSLRAAAKRK